MKISKRKRAGRPPKGNRQDRRPSRFFQIILPHMLDHNYLRIPKRFADMRVSWELPTVATLRVPTGLSWKVTLTRKDDNRLYFTHGWKQFMEHNSIQSCYMLEFEYRGYLNFRVHIFDLSCCEVPYSWNQAKTSSAGSDHEIDDQLPTEESKILNKTPNEEPPVPKEPNILKKSPNEDHPVPKESVAKEHLVLHEVKIGVVDNEELVDESAKDGHPYSFTIVMQKYIMEGNYVHLPVDFIKRILMSRKVEVVKLQLDDGREWLLRCSQSKDLKKFRLVGKGWTELIRETKMKIGDLCTFEVVDDKSEGLKLKVIKIEHV